MCSEMTQFLIHRLIKNCIKLSKNMFNTVPEIICVSSGDAYALHITRNVFKF